LTFESESQLLRIEKEAFSDCFSLKAIRIPGSVNSLVKDWALKSSFRSVIFEAGASLRTMLENGDVDLNGRFQIEIVMCDCELDLAAYSIDVRRYVSTPVTPLKADSQA
jgi:hypothetical protein